MCPQSSPFFMCLWSSLCSVCLYVILLSMESSVFCVLVKFSVCPHSSAYVSGICVTTVFSEFGVFVELSVLYESCATHVSMVFSMFHMFQWQI